MASQCRDAIVGISVYQQKCMTRSDGKYVRFMHGAQTPRLRYFPTYAITYGPITPTMGAEPSPHSQGTVE